MLSPYSLFLAFSSLSHLVAGEASAADWQELGTHVNLLQNVPFAQSCFSGEGHNDTQCRIVQLGYDDAFNRTNSAAAFMNPQWESCQSSGAQCTLDYLDPTNPMAFSAPSVCELGSVPGYYIDVASADDVVFAFNFSRETGTILVVKNTGHDFKGRSSAPGSLALWTHNLKNITLRPGFVAQGTNATPHMAMTMAAGVQWLEAYEFADAHNVTIVGGTDPTVGTVGGWLQGGGHSALSNTMGLGVDRVLEFKIVTPDGQTRIANAAQNIDLFWALRGGGGGTFGVTLEATVQVSPPVTLQMVMVAVPDVNQTITRQMYTIMVDNALQWAEDGWAGYASLGAAFYVTPLLNSSAASTSMAPLIELGSRLQEEGAGVLLIKGYTSWLSFFTEFFAMQTEFSGRQPAGYSVAMSSRLIPTANFGSVESRTELVQALLDAYAVTETLLFDVTAPTSFQAEANSTSVTPAWRDSVYHMTSKVLWNWNATIEEKRTAHATVGKAMDYLRAITPDAAYSSESDLYEPNFELSFWGSNYAELASIKQKYDPNHLLDCWQCVGWQRDSSRFSCYL